MDLRTRLCFALCRRLMRPPSERVTDRRAYNHWRRDELAESVAAFSDWHFAGKDVLDFGCADGPLSLFVAQHRQPARVVGVDIDATAIEHAAEALRGTPALRDAPVEFLVSTPDRMPVPDRSFDTLLAIDCVEHLMSPGPVLAEWFRVLRPGGRCLIRWFPYRGPWGPHMTSLVPIPWAHVLFGERALFRTAAMIYDLPEFVPRHWDLDEHGNKKPNKWRAWSTFEEQGHINKLRIGPFRALAARAGFHVARDERHSFSGSLPRRVIAQTLMHTPLLGEYCVSHVVLELERPEAGVAGSPASKSQSASLT